MRRRCAGTNSDALRSSDDRCARSERREEEKPEEKSETKGVTPGGRGGRKPEQDGDYAPEPPHVRAMESGQCAQVSDMSGEHSAGASVAERDRDRADVASPSPPFKQRSLRAVYVLNDGLKAVMASSPESGALQCLQRACDSESALLTTVTFGRLDFGETSVLDSFYDAGEGVEGKLRSDGSVHVRKTK